MFFSIIIPVYNKETYINRGIQSVLNQSFQDFEVIIVNDGSTDSSGQKLAAVSDSRVRLFSQLNSGVSMARNRGVQQAQGLYLLFVDIDDTIHPDYLKHIHDEICRTHYLPLYLWSLTKVYPDGKENPVPLVASGVYVFSEFLTRCFRTLQHHRGLMGYVANKAIRRDFIMEHGIAFNPKYRLAEDFDFFLQCYESLDCICVIEEFGYHYYLETLSSSAFLKQTYYEPLMTINRRAYNLLCSHHVDATWLSPLIASLAVLSIEDANKADRVRLFNLFTSDCQLKDIFVESGNSSPIIRDLLSSRLTHIHFFVIRLNIIKKLKYAIRSLCPWRKC